MSPSAGTSSLRRTLVAGFFVFMGTIFLKMGVFYDDELERAFITDMVWELALLVLYLTLVLTPASVVYRRPALKLHALFWLFYRIVILVAQTLILLDIDAGYCLYVIPSWTLLGVLNPVVMYVTLLRDSLYWQGLFVDSPDVAVVARVWAGLFALCPCCFPCVTCNRKQDALSAATGINSPGTTVVEEGSSLLPKPTRLEPEKAVMGVIESFTQLGVTVIPAGMVNFGNTSIFGKGGQVKEFTGRCKGQPVAIKARFCSELTHTQIASFLEDAKILAGSRHPNVVEFKGVCISPPLLCVLTELCSTTLYDFLRSDDGLSLLVWSQKLKMMIDMSRGLAHLHAQQPPIPHGNLSTRSFMVTRDLVVKVSSVLQQKFLTGEAISLTVVVFLV